jgi:hypothetical protein
MPFGDYGSLGFDPEWDKNLLNNTKITIGCNNVFGHDPPDAQAVANYADFLYDSTGRFVLRQPDEEILIGVFYLSAVFPVC